MDDDRSKWLKVSNELGEILGRWCDAGVSPDTLVLLGVGPKCGLLMMSQMDLPEVQRVLSAALTQNTREERGTVIASLAEGNLQAALEEHPIDSVKH